MAPIRHDHDGGNRIVETGRDPNARHASDRAQCDALGAASFSRKQAPAFSLRFGARTAGIAAISRDWSARDNAAASSGVSARS